MGAVTPIRDWAPGRPKYKTEAERKAAKAESARRTREKYPDAWRETHRNRTPEQKAEATRKAREYQKQNPEVVKAYQLNYMRQTYSELRDAVIEMFGSKCKHCDYSKDTRALQIDHIDGTGRKERKHIGWYRYFHDILQGKPGYQLLCANCNYIKRYDNNEVHLVDEKLKTRKDEVTQ